MALPGRSRHGGNKDRNESVLWSPSKDRTPNGRSATWWELGQNIQWQESAVLSLGRLTIYFKYTFLIERRVFSRLRGIDTGYTCDWYLTI